MNPLPLTPPQINALANIRRFFDAWSLPSALREAGILFKKAAGSKAWRTANPYAAVELCRQLNKLSKAAYILRSMEDECPAKNIHPGAGIRPMHYTPNTHPDGAYCDFPRQLAIDEYRHPALALSRYCQSRSKKQWKLFYRQLAQCALSSISIFDYEKPGKLFSLRRQVFTLVEACHLLYVRLEKTPACLQHNVV